MDAIRLCCLATSNFKIQLLLVTILNQQDSLTFKREGMETILTNTVTSTAQSQAASQLHAFLQQAWLQQKVADAIWRSTYICIGLIHHNKEITRMRLMM